MTTTKGQVRGVEDGPVIKFLGIPYAAPPVGALRFRAPEPRAAWSGVLNADKPGPLCPQNAGAPGAQAQDRTEDCLYLNVWRPAGTVHDLPVLVYIPGGAFVLSGGSGINGSALAADQHVIVVTFNYRLGILGFLASPALDNGSADSGDYGIQDVGAVLRWVKDNIAAFGGNPDNVTLGGESAGALMTCMSAVSPDTRGLFQKMIVQSGPCAFNWPKLQAQYRPEEEVLAALHCDVGSPQQVAACLRSPKLTAADFLNAQKSLGRRIMWGPSVGGSVLPEQPATAIGSLPTLMGFVKYELIPGFYSFQGKLGDGTPNPANETEYLSALETQFGAHASAVAQEYPLDRYRTGNLALNTITADKPGVLGICTDVKTFGIAQRSGKAPLYAYEFDDPNAPPVLGGQGGPVHVSNQQYVFPHRPLPAASQSLSERMIAYWGNFIRDGNPNGEGLARWPRYEAPADVLQLVPYAIRPGIDVNAAHHCMFWDRLDG
ncbi:MAG TPA: carboxylesterase family protein [Nevskiaceae bacterium]